MKLGSSVPDFSLVGPFNCKRVLLDDVMGEKGIFMIFVYNHCPFVKHIPRELHKLGLDIPELGVRVVVISFNNY